MKKKRCVGELPPLNTVIFCRSPDKAGISLTLPDDTKATRKNGFKRNGFILFLIPELEFK